MGSATSVCGSAAGKSVIDSTHRDQLSLTFIPPHFASAPRSFFIDYRFIDPSHTGQTENIETDVSL